MNRARRLAAPLAVAAVLVLGSVDAHAFRMIQNTNAIRTSTGYRVTCDDPGGFTHRTTASVNWRLNPASQGGKAGVAAAFQGSLAAWSAVSSAGYTLGYSGTTNAGFVTDGVNTVLWANGNGCSGGCLAITALVLGPGQEIREADISFNDAFNWNTGGGDYDVQAIATHELGHSMGIHHTEITRKRNRPTMYASYIGTEGRTLEDDDRAALTCAYDRYPPGSSVVLAVGDARGSGPSTGAAVRLVSRPRPGGATLRFALADAGPVRLDVFDVAGRKLTTLLDEPRGTGEHELAWNGATASGRARPGLYFARVVTARGEAHATVLLEE